MPETAVVPQMFSDVFCFVFLLQIYLQYFKTEHEDN